MLLFGLKVLIGKGNKILTIFACFIIEPFALKRGKFEESGLKRESEGLKEGGHTPPVKIFKVNPPGFIDFIDTPRHLEAIRPEPLSRTEMQILWVLVYEIFY